MALVISVTICLGLIVGGVTYATVYKQQQTTMRMNSLEGIDRCIFICEQATYVGDSSADSGQFRISCLDRCEINYEGGKKIG